MAHTGACPKCLRRSWLLTLVAPYIERALADEPSPRPFELLRLDDEALVLEVAPKVAGALLGRVEALPESYFTEALRAADCWATCRHDGFYPGSLHKAPGAPTVLFGRGDPAHLVTLKRWETATIVGARRATSYGREMARTLGHDLAAAGITVVSGLSFGVNSSVVRGAVETGHPVVVLPGGPDIAYPAAHRTLWRKVTERGITVSEFPPDAAAWRWTFPARRRIMAALAGVTVVVEAAEDSGALATARLARRFQHELGAVPGPATSRRSVGANALLAEGAYVVRDAKDVLAVLHDSAPEPEDRAADLPSEHP